MAATYPNQAPEAFSGSVSPFAGDVYVLPASVAQQRFWLLDQLHPGNTSLNMPLALRLEGELDVRALRRTLNEIVGRHEVLRTTFALEDGKLTQIITAETELDFEVVDLGERPASEREKLVNRLMTDEAHLVFDLRRGPLFKAKLLRLGARENILLLTLHHIICDGWSNGILVRELGEIYDAFAKGRPSPLPELPIQYADFALWQQQWLESERFDEQLTYWKGQLGSELPVLEVPTDFPRNRNRTSFGAIESLLLPRPLTRALKALSQREDVTPFMTFLAAFKILLHLYSGQRSVLVGSPTANRFESATEGLIGAFANTLLLKTDLSGQQSLREVLQQVKEVSLGAFGNQTLPFEKLVEVIKPAQSRNSTQLFQVLFVFQTAFMQPLELGSLSITPIRSVSPGSIFELSLGVVERAEGTRLQLEYNTDLFEVGTITLMLGQLQSILHLLVTHTEQQLSEIPFSLRPSTSQNETTSGPGSVPEVSQAGLREVSEGPGDAVTDTLKEIWEEVLHVRAVGLNDDFFQMGGHSLLAAQLFDQIARKLGVNLPLATLFKATTIASLAQIIREEKPKEKWTSLVPIRPGGTKPPLFLVHAAGGNVLFYKDLVERLGPDQPCYGLQARGLDGKQIAYTRIEDMAAQYIKEIVMVQPTGPYRVGGSSFGGLVAYEIAMQLYEQGKQVDLVAVFDTHAPGYPKFLPGTSKLKIKFSRLLDRIAHHVDTLRILEPGERWLYFQDKRTKAKHAYRRAVKNTKKTLTRGVLRSLGRPLPEALVKTQNAIIVASKSYRPKPYPGVITLFRATRQQRGIYHDEALGWREFAAGGLEIHEVPGAHGSIVVEPRVRLVVERLEDYLSGQSRPHAARAAGS